MTTRVMRIIFRLDFPRNYEMMDKPGEVARIYEENLPEKFFETVFEENGARRLTGRTLLREQKRFRSMSVEPTAIVCDLECVEGIPTEDLDEERDFVAMCTAVNQLLKKFEIRRIERAGLRLFMFGEYAGGVKHSVARFRSLISPPLIRAVEAATGDVTDVGFGADTKSKSGTQYKLKTGPLIGAEEYPKYFSNVLDLLPKEPRVDTVTDIDIFETKFAFMASNIVKWCSPNFLAAANIANQIKQLIGKESAK